MRDIQRLLRPKFLHGVELVLRHHLSIQMDLEAQTSSATGSKSRGKSEDLAKMADGF